MSIDRMKNHLGLAFLFVLLVTTVSCGQPGRFEPGLGPWYEVPKYVAPTIDRFVNRYQWDKFGVDRTSDPQALFCQGPSTTMKFKSAFLRDTDIRRYPYVTITYRAEIPDGCSMEFFIPGAAVFGRDHVLGDGKWHTMAADLSAARADFASELRVHCFSKGGKLIRCQVKDVRFTDTPPTGLPLLKTQPKATKPEQARKPHTVPFTGGEGWRGRPTWSVRMEHHEVTIKNDVLHLKLWGAGHNMKFANIWQEDVVDLSRYSWAKIRLKCTSVLSTTDYFLILGQSASGGLVTLLTQQDIIADNKWHTYLVPLKGGGPCRMMAVQVIPGAIRPAKAQLERVTFLPEAAIGIEDFIPSEVLRKLSQHTDKFVKIDVEPYGTETLQFALRQCRLKDLNIRRTVLGEIIGTAGDKVVTAGLPGKPGRWVDVSRKGSELNLVILSRLPLNVPHPYQNNTGFSQSIITRPSNFLVELEYDDGSVEKWFPYQPGVGFRMNFGPGCYVVPIAQGKTLRRFRMRNNMELGRFYLAGAGVNTAAKGIWKDEILKTADNWKTFPYYRREEKSPPAREFAEKLSVELEDASGMPLVSDAPSVYVAAGSARFEVTGVDQPRGVGALIVYTPQYGRRHGLARGGTGSNEYGVEVIVREGKVVDVIDGSGNAAIPRDGYVLSCHKIPKNKSVWSALGKLEAGSAIRLVNKKGSRLRIRGVNKIAKITTGIGVFTLDLSEGLKWKGIDAVNFPSVSKLHPEVFSLEVQSGELKISSPKDLPNVEDKYNSIRQVGKWVSRESQTYSSLDMRVEKALEAFDRDGQPYLVVTGTVGSARMEIILKATSRGLEVAGKIFNLSENEEKLFTVKLPVVKVRPRGDRKYWTFFPATVNGALNAGPLSAKIAIGGHFRNRIYGVFEEDSGKSLYLHHTDLAIPTTERRAELVKNTEEILLACENANIFCYPKGKAELFPVLIGATTNGWRGICAQYASWRDGWFKKPAVPQWFRRSFMLNHYLVIGASPGPPLFRIGENSGLIHLEELIEEHRKYAGGVDIIDIYDWMCWRSWYDQTGDYELYTPYKNREIFRQSVKRAQDLGTRVGLFIATKLCFPYQDQWKTVAGNRNLLVDHRGVFRPNCGTYMPCTSTEAWRKYLAEVCRRGAIETGCDMFYLDQCGDGEACWGVTHGHIPGRIVRDIDLLRDIHKAAGAERMLYLEGGMADYALEDFNSSIPAATKFSRESSLPGRIEFQRFFYPHIKYFVHFVFRQGVRDGLHWEYGFNFFNGIGHFVGNLPSHWDTPGRAFLTKIYNIQHKYADVFSSDNVEPLVPTSRPSVFANRFSSGDLSIYTLFNDSFKGSRLAVIEIEHEAGSKYLDLWNGIELVPRIAAGKAKIVVDIDPKGFGAVLVQKTAPVSK